MIKYSIFLLLGVTVSVIAQQIDTTRALSINELEFEIDSLRTVILSMDSEIQQMKQNMVEGSSEVDKLIALFNNEDVETASVEARSRRKRVDALLQAITQRPGELQFNGGATTILQNSTDEKTRETTSVGSFDLYAHTAFGPRTLLFFDLEAIGGNGPDALFATFSGLNGDAGSTQDTDGIDRITMLEAWAEFTMLNESITVTAGKIDQTNYFDNNASANDETMQFISGAFVNNAAFAVPSNSPGFRLRTTLLNRIHFQVGVSNAINSGRELFQDVYKIAGLGFTAFPGSEFESNLRFYGYQHPLVDDASGWGLSFDTVAFGAYNIFARYGQNENELAVYWGLKSSWSAGTRFVKQIAGQSTALGVAYGESMSQENELDKEQILEVYARRQLNKWTHLSPHVQVVWNVCGTAKQVMVLGIRTHFNF